MVVLDDWTDGVGDAPDKILARLLANGMDHAKMPGDNRSTMFHPMHLHGTPSSYGGSDLVIRDPARTP